ncbi:MAG: hypothetical protein R3F11_14285 [Verrucomicrobiales bacterium]
MQSDWTNKIVIVTGGVAGMGAPPPGASPTLEPPCSPSGGRSPHWRNPPRIRRTSCRSPAMSPTPSVAAAMRAVLGRGAPDALIHTAGINTPDRFIPR